MKTKLTTRRLVRGLVRWFCISVVSIVWFSGIPFMLLWCAFVTSY